MVAHWLDGSGALVESEQIGPSLWIWFHGREEAAPRRRGLWGSGRNRLWHQREIEI